MALPTNPTRTWMQSFDLPSRLFETGRADYELYEEDDEFVPSVEISGFDPDEIEVSWNDAVLDAAAEHEDSERGQRKTYHRRFRFPTTVDDEEITARHRNVVLEVRLPVETGATVTGRRIEIET
jgi:HSP20 family protein